MMRITPIRGSERAVDYYVGLVRQQGPEKTAKQAQLDGIGVAEDYYLAAPEEGGFWWGEGTGALGVAGLGTREQLRSLFAGKHPVSGAQLGQAPRENSIRAYDLTFSAPKSVSVLAALIGGKVERDFVEAHDWAVEAVLALLEERTTTRGGRNGVLRLDTGGLAVLAVRHRTSRLLDPQLHTHALVMARVQGSDGRWRALDATMMFRAQRALGTIYQAALRSELARRYPLIRWGAVTKGQAEIKGTEELNAAFSRRTAQMEEKLKKLMRQWKERHPGRTPSEKERCRLERQAAKESRPKKDSAREPHEIALDVAERAGALGFADRARLEGEFLHAEARAEVSLSPEEIARQSILALTKERSVWTFEHIEREVAERIGHSTRRSARAQQRAIETLARKTARGFCVDLAEREDDPAAASRLDREPALDRYTTAPLLEVEQEVVRWFHESAAAGGQEASEATMKRAQDTLTRERTRAGRGPTVLDPEQHHAATLVAGTRPAVVVVGPAGTGKTAMLRLATVALAEDGKRAIALAPSATAAAEVGEATGLPAETVAMYLTERRRGDGMKPELVLRPGDTIVVDEAGTMTTQDYHRMLGVCRSEGLRLVLVGDPRQLSAVGRGGMMNHASEILPAIELEKVHRFREPWEGEASLALRQGRREALDAYEQHGRIQSGDEEDMHERMLDDWWSAHRARESYSFSVPTRAQAAHLSERAQERRMQAGELDASASFATARGQQIHVGDTVQTRRNMRRPAIVQGGMVRNRETWTVTAIEADGSVTLARTNAAKTRRVRETYARERIELAYFSTVHNVQGRTVQRCGTLIDGLAGFRSFYVGMTRGRLSNRAYVVAEDEASPREVCERAMLRDRADLGVLAQQRALEELDRKRTAHPTPERRVTVIEQARQREREKGDLGVER